MGERRAQNSAATACQNPLDKHLMFTQKHARPGVFLVFSGIILRVKSSQLAILRYIGIGAAGTALTYISNYYLISLIVAIPHRVWPSLLLIAAPVLMAAAVALALSFAVKSYRSTIGRLVLFFSFWGIYIYFFPYTVLIRLLGSMYAIVVPAIWMWVLIIIPASLIAYAVHLYFYRWKASLKTKVIIATLVFPILYIVLPFLLLWYNRSATFVTP